MTYKVPDYISEIASEGEFDEFDLNTFFLQNMKKRLQNSYIKMKFKNG